MRGRRALDGVRVLDLTRLLPGAYATLLLADLGADVIKIEDPRVGDGMRRLSPAAGGDKAYFERLNRNKRSITLDLRSPEAERVLDLLAGRADVFIESFRPSTARRLRVDADTIRSRHPHLVCASISGFGHRGPYAEVAAHDINYQALAGLLRPPALPGPLVGDIGAAMQAAISILAALIQRAATGSGSTVDVSIHTAALAWSACPTTPELAAACYNLYETADGQWLALGALEPKFWRTFCQGIERPDLVPLQNAAEPERTRVVDEVRAVIRSRTRAEWLNRFAGADACLSVVNSPADAASDPHVLATARAAPVRLAPALGADTDAILDGAGIDESERRRLRAAAVI